MACSLGALALLAGCGAEEHANDPRPPVPVQVSVSITRDGVSTQPAAVGIGPDRSQQAPQNRNVPQPDTGSNGPLDVVFLVANLTDFDSQLEIKGPKDTTSGPMVANGNGTYHVNLPTGVYTISAADIPSAKPARLTVGPYRASSQNDLLLP